jgi:hypothetical protein
VFSSGVFAGSACGFVDDLPAGHAAKSIPPLHNGNGEALIVLGHPDSVFCRLSAAKRMTAAAVEAERKANEEKARDREYAESLRRLAWRESPEGRAAAFDDLAREVERLRAGAAASSAS